MILEKIYESKIRKKEDTLINPIKEKEIEGL